LSLKISDLIEIAYFYPNHKAMRKLKRREFLQKSGIVAAGSILFSNQPLYLHLKKSTNPSVVILGAGIAGLGAAVRLKELGATVTVLEARNRLGGRIFSHKIDPQENLVVELGAEWVGASHERLLSRIEQFGIELQENRFHESLLLQSEYSNTGDWDFEPAWNEKFEALKSQYLAMEEDQHRQMDRYDWWRFLRDQGISDRDLIIRDLADSTDFGESIRSVSAFSAMAEYAESSEYNEMDYKMVGGNSGIIRAFAEDIGEKNIRLNQKVTSVKQTNRGIEVTTQKGDRFNGDYLICAIPTNSVRNIQWAPGFSRERKIALDALQYARIGKNAIQFNQRFWAREDFAMITDVLPHYFYHGTQSQPSEHGVLMSYITGDKADVMFRQNDEYKKAQWLASFQPGFGDVTNKYVKQLSYFWGDDPYSQGAYALYKPNQWFEVLPELAKPDNRIFFAGEHIAEWQGFMEGALTSGEEAAEHIAG